VTVGSAATFAYATGLASVEIRADPRPMW